MLDRWGEIPPTAGLPSRWTDFLRVPPLPLEDGLAALLKLRDVQIECSGTAALIVALTTLKEGSARRSVVLPAYTCPLVAMAVLHCGLKPVPCDLRRDHFDLCPDSLEKACGGDTLAVVPTHLGGRVADVCGARETARKAGARVIEDAAQSMGASWRGQPVGTLGDIGFYSLAVGKGLTLYEGGALVARDESMRRLLRETSDRIVPRSLAREFLRFSQIVGYTALYRPFGLRFAHGAPLRRALRKGDLIRAAGDDLPDVIPIHRVGGWRRRVGANALKRLPSFLEAVAAQGIGRKAILSDIPGVAVMEDPEGGRGTWPFLMVLMPDTKARDAALARLWPAGLGVGRLFIHALPDHPRLAGILGQAKVPNARDFAARMLTISNSPWLTGMDFLRIRSALADCARG